MILDFKATLRAWLFAAEHRQLRLAQILHQVGALLTTDLSLEEIYEQIFDLLAEVIDYDSVSLHILTEDGRRLRYTSGRGFPSLEEEKRFIESRPLPSLERVELPPYWAVIPDTQADDTWVPGPSSLHYIRSWIGAALMVQGRLIGILNVDSATPRAYDRESAQTVAAFAGQVAIAIEKAHLIEAERRQLHLAQTLQRVGALLTASLSLDEVYEQIFDSLAEVVTYDSVSIQLLNEPEGRLYFVTGRGFADVELARQFMLEISDRSLEKMSQAQWVVIGDTRADPQWVPGPGSLEKIRSWIGVALLVQGRLIGILNVDRTTPHTFDEETAWTVAAFANQAAVAIENARLHDETRRWADKLAVLHQVTLATATVVDVDDLLRQTTELIAANIYADMFGFLLLDEEKRVLVPHASYHGASPNFLNTIIPLEGSVVGMVVQMGMPRLVADVRHESFYFEGLPATRSKIAVPLQVHGHVLGVIDAESPQIHAFSETDLSFLVTLAGQVATTIERAHLYEALQQQATRLAQEVDERTAELQAERDRTLAILESAGEGIILTDVEAHILYANPAMERLSGYAPEDLLGQNARLFGARQTPKATFANMWMTILSGQRWSGELINRRKDGTLYDAAITITPLFNAEGELSGFVGVQTDISRHKEVDRLKSKFVTNVSHELRTPLTNIKTYLTLVERGAPERRQKYLTVLHHEADRLARLIQDLLDLSRLEAEAPPDSSVTTDPCQLVNDHFEAFMAKADSRKIHFRLNMPVVLPSVMIEGRHLAQLLTNLLGNAFDYTPEGGQVHMSAGVVDVLQQPMIWFRVTDTGPGIPHHELPHLFERFYRGQLAQESGVSGTGLGLAICKEIVDRYGGRITAESEPGQGSSFTVWLLATDDQLPARHVPFIGNS